MTGDRPARNHELTLGDRVISALLGGLCGFSTMLLIWFLVLNLGGRRGDDIALPFFWTWIAGGVAGAAGFLAGPERMMDGFGKVWRVIGWMLWGGRR
jgi:hypothetical protein